jgi:putative ABC transport system permease protein
MKFFPLIWAGLGRKKLRTIFTLLSILVAFLLFGLLQGVNAAFNRSFEGAHVNRLFIQSKISFTDPLPEAYGAQIARVPGVTGVTFANWFGGYFQDPKNFIFSFPVDVAHYFDIYPEYVMPKEQFEALANRRSGCIIGQALAETYGWKIGDKIPIKSTIWTKHDNTSDWTFDVVGIFTYPGNRGNEKQLFFNNDYFDEARAFGKGMVGWYIVRIDNPTHAAAIISAIDALFANSTYETKTMTENERAQAFIKQLGDINFIVSAIIGAVFFTLLFLTGNTMMQSVRERIPEFAVLKTLGYSDRGVLALVVAEGLVLTLTAASLGLVGSIALFPLLEDVVGIRTLPWNVVALGIGCAALLALLTALPPALRAGRINIVDALAGR